MHARRETNIDYYVTFAVFSILEVGKRSANILIIFDRHK